MEFNTKYIMPYEIQQEIAEPVDLVFEGNQVEVTKQLISWIQIKENVQNIITVGDVVTELVLNSNILKDKLQLAIFDNKTHGKPYGKNFPQNLNQFQVVQAENYGKNVIFESVFNKIRDLLQNHGNQKFFLEIKGEEDLLIIPTILYSKLKSVVIYGCENGLVLVEVTKT